MNGLKTQKPPVYGYDYTPLVIAENLLDPSTLSGGAPTFPTVKKASTFKFSTPVVIIAVSLTSSMRNPNGVSVAALLGRGSENAYNVDEASNFFYSVVSVSTSVTTRTGGMGFGETSGILVPAGEEWGVWVAGDSGTRISYTAILIYTKNIRRN